MFRKGDLVSFSCRGEVWCRNVETGRRPGWLKGRFMTLVGRNYQEKAHVQKR